MQVTTVYYQTHDIPIFKSIMGELPGSVWANPPKSVLPDRNFFKRSGDSASWRQQEIWQQNTTPGKSLSSFPRPYLKLQQKFWKCADPGLAPLNFSEYPCHWWEKWRDGFECSHVSIHSGCCTAYEKSLIYMSAPYSLVCRFGWPWGAITTPKLPCSRLLLLISEIGAHKCPPNTKQSNECSANTHLASRQTNLTYPVGIIPAITYARIPWQDLCSLVIRDTMTLFLIYINAVHLVKTSSGNIEFLPTEF